MKEFTISQATNSWTEALSIKGWTYGETANAPSAAEKFGNNTIVYTYSNSKNGKYTADVPTQAGTWYVKAIVAETSDYAGVESEPVSFEIAKAEAPEVVLPDNLSAVQDDRLNSVPLPQGWRLTIRITIIQM